MVGVTYTHFGFCFYSSSASRYLFTSHYIVHMINHVLSTLFAYDLFARMSLTADYGYFKRRLKSCTSRCRSVNEFVLKAICSWFLCFEGREPGWEGLRETRFPEKVWNAVEKYGYESSGQSLDLQRPLEDSKGHSRSHQGPEEHSKCI